jgi:flagellar biosynthesis protein FliP
MNTVANIADILKNSSDLSRDYLEKEYEHVQLKVFYKLARHTTGTAKKVIFGLILLLILLFGSLALAFYLGSAIGSMPLGFLIVAGIYTIVLATAYLLRRKIDKFIINELAQNYFSL